MARSDAGCTQTELARRIGVPQPVISLIERGERRVDVVEFVRIAKALGQNPVDLLSRLVSVFDQLDSQADRSVFAAMRTG